MTFSSSHKHYAVIERALEFIASEQQRQPSLATIAAHCKLSEHHLQRVFSAWAGTSPKRFLQLLNKKACCERLLAGDSLLDSSLATGLSSSSRLHDLCVSLEAVSPGEFKQKGEGLHFFYGLHPTPFGPCFIASNRRGLHQLEFIDGYDQRHFIETLQTRWPLATIEHDQTRTELYARLIFSPTLETSHTSPQQALKLWLQGSTFQLKVWESLLKIPAGSVTDYKSLATMIGQPSAARAVGSAVGRNPIAVLIPCHRVIRRMGLIGEYRWGSIRKQALLGREACLLEQVSPAVAKSD